MSRRLLCTVDFETERIVPRPYYPPRPVGVSLKEGSKKARYYSWGHPTNNNCNLSSAKKALRTLWELAQRGDAEILFHNAKFDVDVAEVFFDCPRLPWDRYHDTLFLLFLDNPHAESLSLKPSAERLLDLPPEEQDAVRDWLLKNYRTDDGAKLSISPQNKKGLYWAGYICKAPGDLVGRYAIGDVDRTYSLYKLLHKDVVVRRKMEEAYNRERRLMPILIDNERQGMPVDAERLGRDIDLYCTAQKRLQDKFFRPQLGDFNLDSDADLAAAMFKRGLLDKKKLLKTDGGKFSMSKDSVAAAIKVPEWAEALAYRSQLNTCLRTFMENWHRTSTASGGKIYTTWNQVKATTDAGNKGARTGRLSSTPNFQNIPKEFTINMTAIASLTGLRLPNLPLVRSYVVPWTKGWAFVDRDYSQQELRIMGHFEDGVLCEAYNDNPWMDVHKFVQNLVLELTGILFKRGPIKTTNFGVIYGMGYELLAQKTGLPLSEATALKKAILQIFPGLAGMYKDMKRRAINDEPIRTWGGREYYCEPPRMVLDKKTGKMRMRTFDYKLVNLLIQGSAADNTKEAWIRLADAAPDWLKVYGTVHDEFMGSSPKSKIKAAMKLMRDIMGSVVFDTPMLSEGKYSLENWAACVPFDKKGELLYEV